MDLLTARVESLDDPQWFLVFVRPAGYPEGAPPGHPQLPFCIVAVATFAETEAIFYNHVRRLQSYQDAFGLLPAPEEHEAAGIKMGHLEGSVQERIVQITCVRESRFLFRYAVYSK